MLKSLHVENFALIDNIDIQFEPGLNIITGETGAGKSILIDALGSAIGEKIATDQLRKGATKAVSECLFKINSHPELAALLSQNDIEDFSQSLILRKELSDAGRSRSFVNDTPATNAVLLDIGNLLVDLHGQHEHQALLNVKYHIKYLDDFGGYDKLLKDVEHNFERYLQLNYELEELKRQEREFSQKKELFLFQIKEITGIDPQIGEDAELILEERILGNSAKIFGLTSEIVDSLYDSENSVYDTLTSSLKQLEELSEIDSKLAAIKKDCEATQVTIQEIAKYLSSYAQKIEVNPERLASIRERLGQFSFLKRKYNRTIDEIITYRNEIDHELQLMHNLDSSLTEKQNEIEAQAKTLSQLCVQLSQQRQAAARDLEKLVQEHLQELGMHKAKFSVKIEQNQFEKGIVEVDGLHYKTTNLGIDFVEFYMAANPGEDLKPLVRVASGGEISRIMLALKSSLAKADKIPVLIFDEIDNGISGRIAQAVGLSLKRLAKTHQIICITHLPQIASIADHHFLVEKVSEQTSTKTLVRKLNDEEKVVEIAKLLGGEIISEAHLTSARELIEAAQKRT